MNALEAENEKLRDEIAALRARLAQSSSMSLGADLALKREQVLLRVELESALEQEKDRLRKLEADREREWRARHEDADRDREREIVQLQQLLIETKMTLAQALGALTVPLRLLLAVCLSCSLGAGVGEETHHSGLNKSYQVTNFKLNLPCVPPILLPVHPPPSPRAPHNTHFPT